MVSTHRPGQGRGRHTEGQYVVWGVLGVGGVRWGGGGGGRSVPCGCTSE